MNNLKLKIMLPIKPLTFLALFICFSFGLFAQQDQEAVLQNLKTSAKPFNQIVEETTNYLTLNPDDKKVAKKFGRWEMFWRNHLDTLGHCYLPYETSLQRKASNSERSSSSCYDPSSHNWNNLSTGLGVQTNNYNNGEIDFQNSGRVESVYAPKNQAIPNPQSPPNIIYAGTDAGGLWRTINGGSDWVNVTDVLELPAGGVLRIVGHPDNDSPNNRDDYTKQKIYASLGLTSPYQEKAGVGMYYSSDGGDTWVMTSLSKPTYDWLNRRNLDNIKDIIIHPFNDSIMYAAGTEIHSSLDGFDTKRKVLDRTGSQHTEIYNSPFTTLNPADTDISIASPWNSFFIDLELIPGTTSGLNDILLATNKCVEPSNLTGTLLKGVNTNNGWRWEDVSPRFYFDFFGNYNDNNVRFTSTHIQKLYDPVNNTYTLYFAGQIPGEGDHLYESRDTGNTWTHMTRMSSDLNNKEVFFVSQNSTPGSPVMYCGNVQLVKRLANGTWLAGITDKLSTSTHADIRDISIYEASPGGVNDKILLANDGGVSYSADGGTNWIDVGSKGLPITQFFGIANSSAAPGVIAGGTIDNGYRESVNGLWRAFILDPNFGVGDGGSTLINERSDTNPIIYSKRNGGVFNMTPAGPPLNYYWATIGGNQFSDILMDADRTWGSLAFCNGNFLKIKELDQSGQPSINLNLTTAVAFSNYTNLRFANPSSDQSDNGIDRILYTTRDAGRIELWRRQNGVWLNPISVITQIGSGPNGIWQTIWNGITISMPTDLTQKLKRYSGISCIATDPNHSDIFWIGFGNYTHQQIWMFDGTKGSWTSISNSNGLPNVPIHDLQYQRGTTGVLWAATDLGVYRYDPAQGQWECYNKGLDANGNVMDLPACVVEDINIDYCKRLIHIGTFGRGIWETQLPVSENDFEYITENTTWGPRSIINAATSIRVTTGNRLTVQGILNMAEGTTIIVEQGAELVVEGDGTGNPNPDYGRITNRCGDMWNGIQVWGDENSPQYGTFPNHPQGVVILKGGATIEHAHTALLVSSDLTSNPNDSHPLNAHNGGLVKASDAFFYNNKRDVSFLRYMSPSVIPGLNAANKSYFNQCTFESNDDFRGTGFHPMVTMWAVHGVRFAGSKFIDNRSSINAGNIDQLGRIGIRSAGANFEVKSYCSNPTLNPDGSQSCNPEVPSKFINLAKGVSSFGNDSDPANFRISVKDASFNCFRGIYMNGVVGITAINNEINTYYTLNNSDIPYGIYLELSRNYWIEGNKLDGFSNAANSGIIVRNDHEGDEEIYRNDIKNYTLGLACTDLNRPATNQLTIQGLVAKCNNFNDNAYDVAIYDDATTTGTTYVGINSFQSGTIDQNTGAVEAAGNLFTPSPQFGHIYNDGTLLFYFYENGVSNAEPTIFNGSTAVSTLFGNDPPNCIDKTIPSHTLEPIDGEIGGGEAIIDLELSEELTDVLDGVSFENITEEFGKTNALKAAMSNLDISNKSTVDNLLFALKDMNTPYHDMLRAYYLEKVGLSSEAEAVLSNIPLFFELTKHDKTMYQTLVSLRNLEKEWKEGGINFAELSDAQIQTLEEFIEEPNIMSSKAFEWLSLNNSLDYKEPLHLPESLLLEKRKNEAIVNSLSIYPNPTMYGFTISYDIKGSDSELILEIVDLMGRLIHSQKLTESKGEFKYAGPVLERGTYHCSIKTLDGTKKMVKPFIKI